MSERLRRSTGAKQHYSSTKNSTMANAPTETHGSNGCDADPTETAEWLESLDYVLDSKGPERVSQLLSVLDESAYRAGVQLPFTATTPYINTIPFERQPPYPGLRNGRSGDSRAIKPPCVTHPFSDASEPVPENVCPELRTDITIAMFSLSFPLQRWTRPIA